MYLGIDIGTSAVKAILVDDAQSIVDEVSVPVRVDRPKPLWSEQDPAEWWNATVSAVKSLDSTKKSGVKAIGLSGQMHGATCLDESNRVLRPAILWNDGRSAQECDQMMKDLPALTQIAGNLAMPGFTAPKLQWLRRHEPTVFAATKKVLLPKDYVRLLMSGDHASDMSDSAGTLWMDVEKRSWSDELLALTGLTQKHMPELYEGPEITGQLSRAAANELGLPVVPICAGGGDNAAGAVGSGTVSNGEGFLSLGTSGVTFLADDSYRPNPKSAIHTFCHALPNLWHQMSVALSAASAMDFVARVTGFENPPELYSAAELANTPSSNTYFLPYLSGERTPHNNPKAKGAFFGLTHADTPTTLAQTALEGVAFALTDGLDALRGAGQKIDSLSVIGGGSRSRYWGRILSAAFGVPLHYRSGASVGPAFGASRLARLSVNGETVEDVCQPPEIDFTITPDPEMQSHYEKRRKTFSQLYEATKELTQ